MIQFLKSLLSPKPLQQKTMQTPKKRDGMHIHWFNDVGSRIALAKARGWCHARDVDDDIVKRFVGRDRNGDIHAYAMEISTKEWEDQREDGGFKSHLCKP